MNLKIKNGRTYESLKKEMKIENFFFKSFIYTVALKSWFLAIFFHGYEFKISGLQEIICFGDSVNGRTIPKLPILEPSFGFTNCENLEIC